MSETKTVSDRVWQIAKEYIDKQFDEMRKNGLNTKEISGQEYEAMVDEVARAVRA